MTINEALIMINDAMEVDPLRVIKFGIDAAGAYNHDPFTVAFVIERNQKLFETHLNMEYMSERSLLSNEVWIIADQFQKPQRGTPLTPFLLALILELENPFDYL